MLRVEGLGKRLGDFEMEGVTFEVAEGEYFVLLGASGTGKTVLLETLTGMMAADSGKIFLGGREITRERIQRRGLGLVFQNQALFPHMTVGKNVAYGLYGRGLGRDRIRERVRELAEEMEIGALLGRMPGTLSGGEAQRVALARALATGPSCLLLDEPLSSLDTGARSRMRALLRKLNRKRMTVIHVTHDYEEAISLGTRMGIMEGGRVVQVDSPERIFMYPRSEFVARFTGIRNFFRGRIRREGAAGGAGTSGAAGEVVEAIFESGPMVFHVTTDLASGPGTAVIRSEDVTISALPPQSSARNVFEGTIIDICRSRPGTEIVIDAGRELAALVTPDSVERLGLAVGARVYASMKATAIQVLEE
ncbi:MAG: ABC transporter ATP-binding protein [Candidatus Krumholzibacteria bacterium]|jgi:molybdopterin-binding protein|nr:ABC transporter ATP-binding protein [Candidatus Krumholzibacteria bacterium]